MVVVESKKYQMFIAGKYTDSSSNEFFPVYDPSNGETIGHVAKGTKEDAKFALESARKAFENPEWRWMDATKRGRILYKLSQLIREKLDELCNLESLNNGKPLRESKGDIAYAARTYEYYAGLADKIQGETIPVPGTRFAYTLREPIGVTVHIVPWNYPFQLASRSIAPALAAGNTVVAKPSSVTPLTALRLGELGKNAGLPDGVLNIVTGTSQEVGTPLVSSPEADLIVLTGSTDTGKEVMKYAAENITPVVLELGGKNPNIVFQDANLDAAVKGAIYGAFTNAGQMCWAGSRLFLHESIHDQFMTKLVEKAKKLKLGPGIKEDTEMGPLVSKAQQQHVLSMIQTGESEGAKLVTGGQTPSSPELKNGFFIEPTIFDEVSTEMKIGKEEIFGPELSVFSFRDAEEVIKAANSTNYGLYAGIWTNNLKLAQQMVARLQTGMVSINEYPITFPQTPFGGYKESGIGSEQGISAIQNYTRIKNVTVNIG
jgi:aldehyde dehydrogenase (NAD+)